MLFLGFPERCSWLAFMQIITAFQTIRGDLSGSRSGANPSSWVEQGPLQCRSQIDQVQDVASEGRSRMSCRMIMMMAE
jgi:hypothetical protein